MSQQKRCFIALNLPASAKQEIFEKLSRKIPTGACKIVEQENLHITLLFLGNQTEQQIVAAKEKMRSLSKQKAFEVELGSIGSFQNRVFWIGMTKGEKELKEIFANLQELLCARGEKFAAHLTIARNKSLPGREVEELLGALKSENYSASFKAETIDFMESVLSPRGPKYEKLFCVELKQ